MALIWDLESDGLLDELTTIHCMSIRDSDTGEAIRYVGHTEVAAAGYRLMAADVTVAHNGIDFDIPAMKKVYPWFHLRREQIRDTLVMARLIFTDMKDRDFDSLRKNKLPQDFLKRGLLGKHSLEAWGERLGVFKGDFDGPWDTYTEVMGNYCDQDTVTGLAVWKYLSSIQYSEEAVQLEHDIADIVGRMVRHGFRFNEAGATQLYAKLCAEREKLHQQLLHAFGCWYVPEKKGGVPLVFTPKRDDRKRGYTAGCSMTKVELIEFNPGSRQQIADRLITKYGWVPREFTDTGQPKVDETTLGGLDYPECKLLNTYLMIEKRIGQLAEGDNGWLKLVKNGRIHGRVNPMGTRTGRMSHFSPNVAQTPACDAPYGPEFRACWVADEGHVLVGVDASGLELRDLAHYLHPLDRGAYAEMVLNGNSADGTDIHTQNQKAVGFLSRNSAKTLIYALVYGGGDIKLGIIALDDATESQRATFYRKHRTKHSIERALMLVGRGIRAKLYKRFPALEKLTDGVKAAQKNRGYLIGMDGRRLLGSSDHAALNTVLQAAGAIAMKKAIVMFVERMEAAGAVWGVDFAIVAMIHDEIQVSCKPEWADSVREIAVQSIRDAGTHFKMRCPLDGEASPKPQTRAEKGEATNWSATH